MPAFNPLGFTVATAITRNMEDRARAAQISVMGGLLGANLPAVALLATAATQGQLGGPTVGTPGTDTTTPTRVQVPELPDDQEEAERVLRARGLLPAIVAVASDEEIDNVIGSDPPAETVVRLGSTVSVLVSAGVEVPRVAGEPYEEAELSLKAAGFDSELRRSEKTGKEDVVERQEPEGGTFANAGSTVTLYVFPPRRRLEPAGSSETDSE